MVDRADSTAVGVEVSVGDPTGGPPCRLLVVGESATFADDGSRGIGPRLLDELLRRSAPEDVVRMLAAAVVGDGAPTPEQLAGVVDRCDDPRVRELVATHPDLPTEALRVLMVDPVLRVRHAAEFHPAAKDLVDDLLPSSGRGPVSAEELAIDPWPRRWNSPTLRNIDSHGADYFGEEGTGAIYREHPAAQMFDWSFPVPLAVEVGGPEFLPPEQQGYVDEVAPGADEVWVVRSVHDPRAWFAVGLVRLIEDERRGRWVTTRTVLGPWLADPRCGERLVRWLSQASEPFPLAVAATLAAYTVLSPGPRHDGRAALGTAVVPGWWRRGWLSPLTTKRADALLQFKPDDPMAPMILTLLSHDYDLTVRRTVARLSALGDLSGVLHLATDHDPEVRASFVEAHLGELDQLPAETVREMAADPLDRVRRMLADSPTLPEEVRRTLADDPDPETSARAAARSPEGPRCGWRCLSHKPPASWECGRAAELQATLDDGSTIGLCRQHRGELNPWGPKVRCTACGINPALYLDLTARTGDRGGPPGTPVCADCAAWISDFSNGGVFTGEDAWRQFRLRRPPGF